MTARSLPPLQFVVLVHRPGPGSVHRQGPDSARSVALHFDWMFEVDQRLRTWATPPTELDVDSGTWEVACESLADHRLHYLNHEGEVSGERGTVTRKIKGVYTLLDADRDLFRATLEWIQDGRARTATIKFYRNFLSGNDDRLDESRASWRLRFSPGRYETN